MVESFNRAFSDSGVHIGLIHVEGSVAPENKVLTRRRLRRGQLHSGRERRAWLFISRRSNGCDTESFISRRSAAVVQVARLVVHPFSYHSLQYLLCIFSAFIHSSNLSGNMILTLWLRSGIYFTLPASIVLRSALPFVNLPRPVLWIASERRTITQTPPPTNS